MTTHFQTAQNTYITLSKYIMAGFYVILLFTVRRVYLLCVV